MNQVAFLKDRLNWQRRNKISNRLVSILKRYGLDNQRMIMAIFHYLKTVTKYGGAPTFPVTAQVVARHADTIRRFQDMGVEFAIHGNTHVDYTMLSHKEANKQLSRAIDIFRKHGIRFSGFRFPYLKRGSELFDQLTSLGFEYDSSDTTDFDVMKKNDFSVRKWQSFEFMRHDYIETFMVTQTALPMMKNNVVEIPVALPDDDLLVDRLLINDVLHIAAIWKNMLVRNFERGEIFVLQLHPERFFICRQALEVLLDIAFRARPKIWMASLKEVNDWWREKSNFRAMVEKVSDSRYFVNILCSKRGTILMKNGENFSRCKPLIENYYPIKAMGFELESDVKPVIGIPNDFSENLSDYLAEEGYVFEVAKPDTQYAVHFCGEEKPDIALMEKRIRRSSHPLLRFWRWPNEARCALSITGDIDCLTQFDFYTRLWE